MQNRISRGKRKDTDEWVYGYYVRSKTPNNEGFDHFIIPEESCSDYYYIIPETISSYTGMNEFVIADKTVNQPLYENDIVEVWNYRTSCSTPLSQHDGWVKVRGIICFRAGRWDVDTDNEYNKEICKPKGSECYERYLKYIGHLFDFGYHYGNEEWHRKHNRNSKHRDIIRIGNRFDNPELLMA